MGFRSSFTDRLKLRRAPDRAEWFVFGLGNPGFKYEHTRHNAGFDVLSIIAAGSGAEFRKAELLGRNCIVDIGGVGVMLVKPQKYMNNSGEVVRDYIKRYRIKPERMLVVYDDVDLALGRIRIRAAGSAGSHKGMQSIVAETNTEQFARVRVGIGHNDCDIIDYVLTGFSGDDVKKAEAGYADAAQAVELIVTEGLAAAQQRYN